MVDIAKSTPFERRVAKLREHVLTSQKSKKKTAKSEPEKAAEGEVKDGS